ncbi:MAG: O-antigen ligase family protein [Actinomycetota bacterium]|nr:O-antigen ligase family protein [Actinomycetota bacterium]
MSAPLIAGLCGGLALAFSAYVISPLFLPALAVGGVFAVAAARWPVVGLAGAVLALPMEALRFTLPTGHLTPAEGAFALVGLLYVGRAMLRPATVVRPSVRDAPIIVLLAVLVAGLAVAEDPAPIVRVSLLWPLFYCNYLQIQSLSDRELRFVILAFAVGVGALGGIGAVDYLQAGNAQLFNGGLSTTARATGTFTDPNYFASTVALGLVPGIAIVLGDLRRTWWLVPFLIAGLLGLGFSLSRGGISALALGFVVLMVWSRARWVALAIAVALAGFVLTTGDSLGSSSPLGTVEQRLSTLTNPAALTEANLRPRIWRLAITVAAEHPIVGIGFRQFSIVATERGLFEGVHPAGVENVHNTPLNFAAENGIVGAAAFLWFVFQLLLRGVRGLATNDPVRFPLALGLFGTLMGFLLQSLTQAQLRVNIIMALFLLVAGAITTLADRARAARRSG